MGKRLSLKINPGATLGSTFVIVSANTISLLQVQSKINSKSFDFVIAETQVPPTARRLSGKRMLHVPCANNGNNFSIKCNYCLKSRQ